MRRVTVDPQKKRCNRISSMESALCSIMSANTLAAFNGTLKFESQL